MSSPIALPGRPDAARADQHVGAGAGAEVEHRLALVQVGHGGRNAAAQRRAERPPRAAGPRRRRRAWRRTPDAALVDRGRAATRSVDESAAAPPLASPAHRVAARVRSRTRLADVVLGQLSHADSSLMCVGGRSSSRPICGGARRSPTLRRRACAMWWDSGDCADLEQRRSARTGRPARRCDGVRRGSARAPVRPALLPWQRCDRRTARRRGAPAAYNNLRPSASEGWEEASSYPSLSIRQTLAAPRPQIKLSRYDQRCRSSKRVRLDERKRRAKSNADERRRPRRCRDLRSVRRYSNSSLCVTSA